MVSTADGSQMVLLTPQGTTSDGMVSLGDGTAQLVNLATLQQNGLAGLASLPLGEGGQQVLVVTDPAQLEALQVRSTRPGNLDRFGTFSVQCTQYPVHISV